MMKNIRALSFFALPLLTPIAFFYQALTSKVKISGLILGISAALFLLLTACLWLWTDRKKFKLSRYAAYACMAALSTLFLFYDLLPNIVTKFALSAEEEPTRSDAVLYVVFAVYWLMMGYAGAVFLKGEKRLKAPSFFLISAIPLVAAYLLLILPGSSPDPDNHYLITYNYTNRLLGSGQEQEWSAREDDLQFYQNIMLRKEVTAEGVWQATQGAWTASTDELVPLPDQAEHMKGYSPISYLPQIIGMALGRLLGLGGVPSAYLARILTAALYILLCLNAVKTAPAGKIIFAVVPLLPMALMMSGAFSYDAAVIACTLNFIAATLALCQSPADKKRLIACIVWAFLIGAIKGGGYLLLLPLALLLLQYTDRKTALRSMAYILAAGLVSCVLFDLILVGKQGLFQLGTADNGMLYASFALRHPIRYVFMALKAYVNSPDEWISNIAGHALGWLEPVLPVVLPLSIVAVCFVCACREKDPLPLQPENKRVLMIPVLLSLCLTPMMLLSITPVGGAGISGLQGRYYLPVLPLALLLLSKFSLHSKPESAGIRSMLLLRCFDLLTALNCLCVYYLMRVYLIR